MTEADLLLLRRGGGLWGVATAEVRRLVDHGDGVRVELGDGALLADEVLGVAPRLAVRPPGAVLRRFWPEPCDGIAVHRGSPVVVVDGRRPPNGLAAAEGEASHGKQHR